MMKAFVLGLCCCFFLFGCATDQTAQKAGPAKRGYLTFGADGQNQKDSPGPGAQALDDVFSKPPENTIVKNIIRPSKEEIKQKVISELNELGQLQTGQVSYDIPITINDQVEYFINYYQVSIPHIFRKWLSRTTRYQPLIHEILARHGLPKDLIYVAMIESGLNPYAYSPANACGMWQFIRATGERYGLTVDEYLDERRDPVKSTVAAARYLTDLYGMFGSWYLAAAGYNAGEGRIMKAMARNDAQDYWELSNGQKLPKETQEYVPRMIAAALIAKEPARYGFTDIEYLPPLTYEELEVPEGVHLDQAAGLMQIEAADMKALNPELRRQITPPGAGAYKLRVPAGKKEILLANLDKLTSHREVAAAGPHLLTGVSSHRHTVCRGEALGKIAKRYGTTVGCIKEANGLSSGKDVRVGDTLQIPLRGKQAATAARQAKVDAAQAKGNKNASISSKGEKGKNKSLLAANKNTKKKFTYRIKKGETVYQVAKKYNVALDDLTKWNGMTKQTIKDIKP
ncbi:MAG: transglycosylase SLT domain-containing protein, partial [Deltaproteobacteria bacterium]|nr:transglycosylase SLT domain-containing protein [Deltaproteobacteria bacterium]